MQFKVPQFLDIEDKIFGPFTFSEFAYLVGGGGLCFILYKLLPLIMAIIPILLVMGFALALVFYKPNGKPFIYMVEASIVYLIQDKLYIWKKVPKKKKLESSTRTGGADVLGMTKEGGKKLHQSKLKDLAWSLDVLDIKKQDHQI